MTTLERIGDVPVGDDIVPVDRPGDFGFYRADGQVAVELASRFPNKVQQTSGAFVNGEAAMPENLACRLSVQPDSRERLGGAHVCVPTRESSVIRATHLPLDERLTLGSRDEHATIHAHHPEPTLGD
jgi:hypothetical protein